MVHKKEKFNALYKSYYYKVYRLCINYVSGDTVLADDLTQEVFIKVWEKFDTFRHDSQIGTWIYRIAVNTCLMHLRKVKHNTVELNEETQLIENQPKPQHDERLFALRKCMNKLNEVTRLLISLTLDNVAQKELSEITGLSSENVRVKIHRAKGQLFKCMTSKKY